MQWMGISKMASSGSLLIDQLGRKENRNAKENCQENFQQHVNVIFLLTDFTLGGLVTEYTVSQSGPNRIALKIFEILSRKTEFWGKKSLYHGRPVCRGNFN